LQKSRNLEVITGLFVSALIISNIVSTKILVLGPLTFDGGTLIFPLTYIFGDILTEVYGYANSRRIIWIGFISCLLMSLTFYLVGILPSASDWTLQEAYQSILGVTPRIVLASLLAYLFGEFSNSFVLSKMKITTKGKFLFLRTIGSTIIGQIFDTGIFVIVAFAGMFNSNLLLKIIISNYIFKVSVEAIMTPVTYKVIGYLKKTDNMDVYDSKESYNPFSMK
jgi:hypothetical protein